MAQYLTSALRAIKLFWQRHFPARLSEHSGSPEILRTVVSERPEYLGPPRVFARGPRPAPQRVNLPMRSIKFLHTGYKQPYNELFSLPCVEKHERDPLELQWGVHHLTALHACQIIVNNASNGFLALDVTGQSPVDFHPDTLLTADVYYFIVPGSPRYSIVPSFDDWRFPAIIPWAWTEAAGASSKAHTDAAGRSEQCIVSGCATTESAHIIPRRNASWFLANAMARHSGLAGTINIDSPCHRVHLSPTLHVLFDSRVFAFVPCNGYFVVQAISQTQGTCGGRLVLGEIVSKYQWRELRMPPQVSPEYLYARFAWIVFHLAKGFVTNYPEGLYVARYRSWNPGAIPKLRIDKLSQKDRADLYGGGTRGASPRKRAQSLENNADTPSSEIKTERSGSRWRARQLRSSAYNHAPVILDTKQIRRVTSTAPSSSISSKTSPSFILHC